MLIRTRLPILAALVATSALVATAAPALAQDSGTPADSSAQLAPRPKKDKRRFLFELKFGPYRPSVDRELDGATPYNDTFGSTPKLMTQLEFDVEIFHFRRFGTLGVGLTWGYWQNSARAFAVMPERPGDRVSDQTTFTVMPLIAQVVYRYDVLALRYNVPIVPYAKAGLAYYFWWIRDGNGDVATCTDPEACLRPDRGRGRGATYGFQFNLGAAFLLDIVDRATARIARHEVGLYHTYLFAELVLAEIANFGRDGALNLSSQTFLAGLAFEF
jgi:hypothetical protein